MKFPLSLAGLAVAALVCISGAASALAQQDLYSLESSNSAVPWQINAAANVTAAGAAISKPVFSVAGWTPGLVPGTAFVAAVNAGLEGVGFDPNYGANIYNVTASKYDQNYWYRTQFTVPAAFTGKTVWLNLDGVNKSGDVYFNGTSLGTLYGFMQRGKYNVTSLINAGQANALAILVHWENSKPIQNYGAPTYMSCIGWDWMPYVPGRETGVTDHVYLTSTQGPTLVDPWMRTTTASAAQAKLAFAVGVNNVTGATYNGTVTGIIQPGNIQFSKGVSIAAGQTATVSMDAGAYTQLIVNNPQLWWPNGYGAPNLYTCEVKLVGTGGTLADDQTFSFGVRQYSYDTTSGVLHIAVNGKPIFVKGGNWGMSEYLLRCRGAEYDTKLRLHADMHMNMIRTWEGCVTDHEFYDACDKYGVMVWEEFWLNSLIGDPNNMAGYNNNVIEKVKRLRNHPAVAVWCGMNEGTPDATITGYHTSAVATYDGNDRLYQPNSHAGNLSGSGYWALQSPSYFFTSAQSPSNQKWGFRTEIGVPVFPTYESFQKFIPPANQWPADDVWNNHFWGSNAPNANASGYTDAVNNRYGTATGIQDFCAKAQLLNIETNKAMYEGFLDNMWNDAAGVMTWMSQSAYPSMIWQTYDYYYDLTGAYWGVKKACEPVHIQWNPVTSYVKVVNTSSADAANVTAQGTVYNKDGTAVPGLSFTKTLTAPSNAATSAFYLSFNSASNLASGKTATASSTDNSSNVAANATDGAGGTRWSSSYNDNQWIYVDLGSAKSIQQVILRWEGTAAYGKSYQIQTSNDATTWTTAYSTTTGVGGVDTINFTSRTARYVKMNGLTRGTQWGFSIYEFEVYGAAGPTSLSDVHFIRLALNDAAGNLLSDNFYWRGTTNLVYTGLAALGTPTVQVTSQTITQNGQTTVTAQVVNPASSPATAFAVRLRLLRDTDGTRILPALMSENYFTLFKGESKTVTMTFDSALLGAANPTVIAQAYNAPLAVTSADRKVFTVGTANNFAVAATGLPAPTLSQTGTLPGGVTFVDNGNGTASISGNPDTGSGATYPLTIIAHNGASTDATQSFSLLINHAPVAGNASLGTLQNTPVQASAASLLSVATDPDGDALAILSVDTTSAHGGTVSFGAGSVTYTPAADFLGGDSIGYTLTDGRGGIVSGAVSVIVSPAGIYTINAASITRTAASTMVAYKGLPGASYQPQYTDSLASGAWTDDGPLLSADSDGQFSYVDKTSPKPTRRFYRVRYMAP